MTVIDVYFAVFSGICAAAIVIALVKSGINNLREWRRNRRYPWFPPEGHPDCDFELPAGERDLFASLMARAEVK